MDLLHLKLLIKYQHFLKYGLNFNWHVLHFSNCVYYCHSIRYINTLLPFPYLRFVIFTYSLANFFVTNYRLIFSSFFIHFFFFLFKPVIYFLDFIIKEPLILYCLFFKHFLSIFEFLLVLFYLLLLPFF